MSDKLSNMPNQVSPKSHKQRYILKGCCASSLEFDCDTQKDTIHNLTIFDSCPGNSTALAKLVEGMSIAEVIRCLEGIDCKKRGTSCPDQIAQSLKQYLKDREAGKDKE